MLNVFQLEQSIIRRMHAALVPGLALAVVRNQDVIYARGFGVTSLEDGGVRVTPQTLFRIASLTKPLVGTAVMRLVEMGMLDLDLPIKAYVNWLRFSEKGMEDRITLRILLSHTVGIAKDFHYCSRVPSGLETFVREQLPTYPFLVPPGRMWLYSNVGIILVGYIAQAVSGKPFTDLMQELVFTPLEMKRTTFDPFVAMTYPLAQAHTLDEGGRLTVEHCYDENTAAYPAGYAISTVLDLANFAIAHMNQGRFRDVQLLSPTSVKAMHTPVMGLWTLKEEGYGLTFRTELYKGVRLVRHSGWRGNFISRLFIAPEERVAVVMLYNRDSPAIGSFKMIYDIFEELLGLSQETPQPRTIEPERSSWTQYVGTYLGIYTGLVTIQVVEDRLTLDLNGDIYSLDMLKKDHYFGEKHESGRAVSVGFLPEEEGSTRFIVVNDSPCERINPSSLLPFDPSRWSPYRGVYSVASAATSRADTLTVRVDGHHLLLYSKKLNKMLTGIPLDDHRFASELGLLEFPETGPGPAPELKLCATVTLTRVGEESERPIFGDKSDGGV